MIALGLERWCECDYRIRIKDSLRRKRREKKKKSKQSNTLGRSTGGQTTNLIFEI